MTLSDLNASAVSIVPGATLRYAVGHSGRRSRLGTTGDRLHILAITRRSTGGESLVSPCNSRHGDAGVVVEGRDTDAVTCSKCLAWLEKMAK